MWRELDTRFPYCTNEYRLGRFKRGTLKYRPDIRRHAIRLQLDAIIELALVCGLRRGEIYSLSIDDCHPDNKYIVVHGKRQDQHPKVREVPYAGSTREAVEAWLRFRAQIGPEPGTRLWLSLVLGDPRRGMSYDQMARFLSERLGGFELHRLRHTCATERLRAGMPLEDLQQFLGHANINMTLRYAKLVREDIHRSAERTDADFQAQIKKGRRAA
jgi:integrase